LPSSAHKPFSLPFLIPSKQVGQGEHDPPQSTPNSANPSHVLFTSVAEKERKGKPVSLPFLIPSKQVGQLLGQDPPQSTPAQKMAMDD
jgi:hypothetical protein